MSQDQLTHCVSCGKRLQRASDSTCNHRCSAQFERRRAAANRRAEDEAFEDEPTFEDRLATGFSLLRNRG